MSENPPPPLPPAEEFEELEYVTPVTDTFLSSMPPLAIRAARINPLFFGEDTEALLIEASLLTLCGMADPAIPALLVTDGIFTPALVNGKEVVVFLSPMLCPAAEDRAGVAPRVIVVLGPPLPPAPMMA